MKILAVDTATECCSAAVADSGAVIAELNIANNQTHSKHLIDMIDAICALSRCKLAELDGFAVTLGPGSFTGLRIGISTIKGLARSLDKPVVGVSSLDALAWQCGPEQSLICAMLDARKHEVYCCRYRIQGGDLIRQTAEQVVDPGEAIISIAEPCLFVGSGALLYQEQIKTKLGSRARFAGWNQHSIRASSVAALSLDRFALREPDDVALLVPRYIRKSDAELHRGKR